MRLLFSVLFSASFFLSVAQPVIYKDASTLITGTWNGSGTIAQVMDQTPQEGSFHYRFDYNFTNWWAGVGLNMDNWGSSAARDLSGYSHLRIAYRGLSAGQTVTIQLRNGSTYGNTVTVGSPNSSYEVVDISMLSLTSGTSLIASAVREIDLSVTSTAQSGSGTVYFDALELVNTSSNGGDPLAASGSTLSRAANLGLGVNTANWLEAWWLLPFNAYPETNKYTRTKIRDLHNAGFTSIRLPVIFERLGNTSAPYDINFGHPAFALIDSVILWAGIYNMKVIIVNHHGYSLTNANYTTELPRLLAVWNQITDHYDYLNPEQFFFEIFNEPTNEISNANWRTVATALVATIRQNETQTHSVLVGANEWNSGTTLLSFTPLPDADIIYTFHNYDPYLFTHQGMSWTSPAYFPARTFPQAGEVAAINQLFANIKNWSNSYAVPVCLGEFGCSTQADAASRCNWIQTLTTAINTNGFPAFYWDAISPSDAFGFFNSGIINQANAIDCFETALGLYSTSVPVELISFEANCNGQNYRIRWNAEVTEANQEFELEQSTNSLDWKSVKQIPAEAGTRNYQIEVSGNGEASYFRLKTTTNDGKSSYSPISVADCSKNNIVKVYPNPVRKSNAVVIESTTELLSVSIIDATGRILTEHRFTSDQKTLKTSISTAECSAGLFTLLIQTQTGIIEARKLLIY